MDVIGFLTLAIGRGLQMILAFLGWVLLKFIGLFTAVASYNDFVNATAVVTGWAVVRDVTNLFFVVALLAIAFGTMFNHATLNYKSSSISKLLFAAILVNFSRTLCGLLIDASQVVMLTFVIGFKAIVAGNLVNALGVNGILDVVSGNARVQETSAAQGVQIVASLALGIVMLAISCATVLYMTLMLLARMVTLWILIVMSPLAIMGRAVPGIEKAWSEWWKQFKQQLLFGPIAAFFMWLSFATLAGGGQLKGLVDPGVPNPGAVATASWDSMNMLSFIIAIAILLKGIEYAKSMSDKVASGWIDKNMGWTDPSNVAKKIGQGALSAGTPTRAIERVQEGAYRAGTYAPFVGGMSAAKLGELQAKQAERVAKSGKPLGNLSEDQQLRIMEKSQPGFAGGVFTSQGAKDRGAALIQKKLDELAKKKDFSKEDYADYRKYSGMLDKVTKKRKDKYGDIEIEDKALRETSQNAQKAYYKASFRNITEHPEGEKDKDGNLIRTKEEQQAFLNDLRAGAFKDVKADKYDPKKLKDAETSREMETATAAVLKSQLDNLKKDVTQLTAAALEQRRADAVATFGTKQKNGKPVVRNDEMERALKEAETALKTPTLADLEGALKSVDQPGGAEKYRSWLLKAKSADVAKFREGTNHPAFEDIPRTKRGVERWQNQERRKPGVFKDLTAADQVESLKGISQQELKQLGGSVSTDAASRLAGMGMAAAIPTEALRAFTGDNGKLNDELANNQPLMQEIADGLKAANTDISTLPIDDAGRAALAAAAAASKPADVLAKGRMANAFPGFNADDGSFASKNVRERFDQWVASQPVARRAAQIPKDDLMINGGLNALTVRIMSKLDPESLETTLRDRSLDPEDAEKLLRAIDAVAKSNVDQLRAAIKDENAASTDEIRAAVDRAREAIESKTAKQILKPSKGGKKRQG